MKIDNIFNKFTKEDWYLITIFFIMTITIILKSYFNSSGYLSDDSNFYLSLAQNLIDNNNFYIYGPHKKIEFFAVWPVGYPFLIFLIAKITGLSVFLSSKLLNILLIGLVLFFFKKLFNKNAYIYGLILFSASIIEIYSFSWSETVFIFCLVWFSSSIYWLMTNLKVNPLIYVSILFSSLFLFLSRYIGAFSFGVIGLVGLYYLFVKKNKSRSVILISITLVNLTLMSLYLHHNFIESGFITGQPRSFPPQSNAHLLFMVINSIILEISFFSNNVIWKNIAFPILLIILLFIKYRKSIINQYINKQFIILPLVFSSIGLVYLIFIVFLSWNGYIEELYYRLLAPGFFLILIALINYFEHYSRPKYFNLFKILLLSISIYSWIINVPFQISKDIKNPNYEKISNFNIDYTYAKKKI